MPRHRSHNKGNDRSDQARRLIHVHESLREATKPHTPEIAELWNVAEKMLYFIVENENHA